MTGRARSSDPSTSFAAAMAIDGERETRLERLVLDTLRAALPGGLTVPEIADANHIDRDTISPRMKSLLAKGLIFNTGHKAIPPGKNRKCIVWQYRDTENFG